MLTDTPLSEAQLRAIRAGMYVARYPSDAPVRSDRCGYAVSGQRQCTGPARHLLASGFYVCPKHANAGGVSTPRSY